LNGCATDRAAESIQNILSQEDQAQVKLNGVSDVLDTIRKKADDKGKPITKKDLTQEDVKTAFKELHEAGKILNKKKDEAERLKGTVTPERASALWEENKGNILAKKEELDKAWRRLKEVTQKVRANAEDEAITYLDEELRTALAEFEALTRQK